MTASSSTREKQNRISRKVQEDLEKLYAWSEKWLMKFNVGKCHHLFYSGKKKDDDSVQYRIGGEVIGRVQEEIDLGVTINDRGKNDSQCRKAAKNANAVLGMIRRTVKDRNRRTLVPLYKSLVRPHLDYCSSVWRPYYKKDVKMVESVQRRFTRMVSGTRGLSYGERREMLGLQTVETRHLRADLILAYKVLTGKVDFPATKLFRFSEKANLRGHPLKLEKERVRTKLASESFGARTVNVWNRLPSEVVSAPSLSIFKTRLQNCMESGITETKDP
jgi:hypothetical protein